MENKPDIRELTLKKGLDFPNDEELLMMILGTGTRDVSVRSLARSVNEAVDETFGDEMIQKLTRIKGMGQNRALQVAAAVEYGRRKNECVGIKVRTARDLVPFVQTYAIKPKEHFLSITLNGNHEIIQIHVMGIGSVTSSAVYPREIFSEALLDNAAAIILCHNHPSGNLIPSDADLETTSKMLDAAEVLGVPVLDHIIIGGCGYFSFLEHDLLFTKV